MLTHTTARGLQAEKFRRATRPSGRKSDQELTVVSVNWKKISVSFAAGVTALAIFASSVGQASPVVVDQPVPSITEESDNAPTWEPAINEMPALGGNLGPIRPD